MKVRVETEEFIVEGDNDAGEYRVYSGDQAPANAIIWTLEDVVEFVDVMRHHFGIFFGNDPPPPGDAA